MGIQFLVRQFMGRQSMDSQQSPFNLMCRLKNGRFLVCETNEKYPEFKRFFYWTVKQCVQHVFDCVFHEQYRIRTLGWQAEIVCEVINVQNKTLSQTSVKCSEPHLLSSRLLTLFYALISWRLMKSLCLQLDRYEIIESNNGIKMIMHTIPFFLACKCILGRSASSSADESNWSNFHANFLHDI